MRLLSDKELHICVKALRKFISLNALPSEFDKVINEFARFYKVLPDEFSVPIRKQLADAMH